MEKKLEAEWLSYLFCVIPPGAHEIQVKETKKAFFAGAFSALTHLAQSSNKDTAFEGMLKEIKDHIEQMNYKPMS